MASASNARAPPVDPATMDPEQRKLHDMCVEGSGSMFQSQFKLRDDNGALLGPFAPMLQAPPAIAESFFKFSFSLGGNNSLPPSAREIAILVTGANFGAAFELYSHSRVAEKSAAIPRETVVALCEGRKPSGLSPSDDTAYDVAKALVGTRGPLSKGLWERGVNTWGREDAGRFIEYCAAYSMVAVILNGYDVGIPNGEALYET